MGSVSDYIDCPRCKQYGCSSDFYYKTGEEYIFCENCGYSKSISIKNRSKPLNELKEEDWEIIENKNPYAAFRYKSKNSVAYGAGHINKEEDLNSILENIDLDDIEEFTISRFTNNKIIISDLKSIKRYIQLKKVLKNLEVN